MCLSFQCRAGPSDRAPRPVLPYERGFRRDRHHQCSMTGALYHDSRHDVNPPSTNPSSVLPALYTNKQTIARSVQKNTAPCEHLSTMRTHVHCTQCIQCLHVYTVGQMHTMRTGVHMCTVTTGCAVFTVLAACACGHCVHVWAYGCARCTCGWFHWQRALTVMRLCWCVRVSPPLACT